MTTLDKIYTDETTLEKVKMPKMKLKPFSEIIFDHIEIALLRFETAGTGPSVTEDAYGAMAIAWISSAKTDDFPIAIRLPIAGHCYIQVAYDALQAVTGLCDSIADEISVTDEESGEELFVLSSYDVIEEYSACEECVGSQE